ncbi:hypothetical protein J2853_007862 [Streptosporangium lutulentum]|uniref:Uncharacterized protein n=1 Tax=Streptosporangium lutulentum TaxID=1461250 RepID=A0ABT9QPG6_9ACTN|nr:hypothetical protein [Streptosporangium lutulentum]
MIGERTPTLKDTALSLARLIRPTRAEIRCGLAQLLIPVANASSQVPA